jgi:UDP-N-acetylglucosamine diphosphorylase / glucose-1-phosphate thymidylyltransferase / UDP-N-acetylgalactosamine diphosphorylase / glucosamine-1-phosphate N-acetyltransferase / galactosamine-1-phosphate N-acetyltransferase
MSTFSVTEFFDLSEFAHAGLFKLDEPIWACLKRIESYLLTVPLGQIEGIVETGAYLVDPQLISIGPGTIIEAGAYIKGPCVIGQECQIRHGAYIRGNLLAGNRCVIGHATEVKNSVFLNGAQASHFAYVGDSILGNHVNLGAGTKCANLRFDNQSVHVLSNGQQLNSGLRKFGAIFGDHAQTGCNSVTNPGTIMGKASRLAPCETAHGVVPAHFVIKAPANILVAL